MGRKNRNRQRNVNIPEERGAEGDGSRDVSVNTVTAVRCRKKPSHSIFIHPLPLHHSRYRAERKRDVKTVETIESKFNVTDKELLMEIAKEFQTDDYFDEISHRISFYFSGKKRSILAYYNPLVSVLQSGNTCGFAALSMASQLFRPVGVEELFKEARRQGLTLIGEMFDAYEMAEFATEQLDCAAKVICDLKCSQLDILSHICDGWPVLIAYDHSTGFPGRFGGERAHWAVLSGLFFDVSLTVDAGRQLRIITTTKSDRVKGSLRLLLDCSRSSREVNFFVLAQEGLKKRILAWPLDILLRSNNNLSKCSQKFGLPRDYELHNLQDKAILLMGI